MGNRTMRGLCGLLGMLAVAGCGGSDDGSAAGGGSGGAAPTGGASGMGGTTTNPAAVTFWDFLPAGEGARGAERKATCEAACDQEGACGFVDPGACRRDCADPRLACQADRASDACWSAMVAFEACMAALSCADLNYLHYSGSSVRPCQPEIDTLGEACGFVETIAADECLGAEFDCGDGTPAISRYWVCDGEADCADGSDETVCPWYDEGPPNACRSAATIDGEDTAGDIAALAGVTCINGTLTIGDTALADLRGLEGLSSVRYLVIGGSSSLFATTGGNPQLQSLAGLEGLRGVSSLSIEGNPLLRDLSALAGLTFVTSTLTITENDSLTSLEGLQSIEYIDELEIGSNPALAELRGLRGLTFVAGLSITDNDALQSLTGLEQLPFVGDVGLDIAGNSALLDLTGLNGIAWVGNSFYLSSNDALTSLNGLESLTRFAWSVSVSRNPVLDDISALRNVTEIRGDVTFSDNPLLPTCSIDAWLTPLSLTCSSCTGNDDAATCG